MAPPTQLATTMMMMIALFEIPDSFFSSFASAAVSVGAEVSDVSEAETVCVRVTSSTTSVFALLSARFGSAVVPVLIDDVSEVLGGNVSVVEVMTAAGSEVDDPAPSFRADEMPDPIFPSKPPPVVEDAAALPAPLVLPDGVFPLFAAFVFDATGLLAVLLAWPLLPPAPAGLLFPALVAGVDTTARPEERAFPVSLPSLSPLSLEPPPALPAALL